MNVDQHNEHVATALISASYAGHDLVVQQLLNQGANADFQNKGATTLITASYFGHVNVVKTLLSYEIKVNQQADAGSTALVATTFKGHREIVKLLLN